MKIKYFILIITFLTLLSAPTLAEKVLMVDLTISNNDSVVLNNLMLVDGKMKQWNEGNYKIQLLDSSNSVVESQLLPIDFFISGFGEMDTTIAEARFSNYESAKRLQVLKDGKMIFEAPVALCNNDKVCDNYENSLSCPNDCPSGSSDKYCDHQKDSKCDPNCAKQADEDCQSSFGRINPVYLMAGLAIVAALILLFILKKKSDAKPSGLVSREADESESAPSAPLTGNNEVPAVTVKTSDVDEADAHLAKWAKKQLAAGYTPEQLSIFLTKHGYQKEVVERVLDSIK